MGRTAFGLRRRLTAHEVRDGLPVSLQRLLDVGLLLQMVPAGDVFSLVHRDDRGDEIESRHRRGVFQFGGLLARVHETERGADAGGFHPEVDDGCGGGLAGRGASSAGDVSMSEEWKGRPKPPL